MFGNHIHLRIAKRLETEEQRESLRLLKRDIFNPAKNVMTTFKEHGFRIIHSFSEITSPKNITYFKFRAHSVNKQVHKTLHRQVVV